MRNLCVFRVDSSLQIGTGHLMRCLTLACALRDQGWECVYICRDLPGSSIARVRSTGFAAFTLPRGQPSDGHLRHSNWLEASWQKDAKETKEVVAALGRAADLLVVDHYALDAMWEMEVHGCASRLMVIDDLADRVHECNVLLDQTFSRRDDDYVSLVPAHCQLLLGSVFSLVREEFALARARSIARRVAPKLKRILVFMGGIDIHNDTSKTLQALARSSVASDALVIVVVGSACPWIEELRCEAANSRLTMDVRVQVENMADLLADADLAVGAGGTSSWERCAVGVPAIIAVVASNQDLIASSLEAAGAAYVARSPLEDSICLAVDRLVKEPQLLASMSRAALQITDGQGVQRVVSAIKEV